MKQILTILMLAGICISAEARVWQVGPSRTHKYCSSVASLVQDGDTVDIDAATYVNDVQVTWAKNNLLLRGAGGRPVLVAGSIIANDAVNGKGIFVLNGSNTTVENIEFRNARVLSHNGAGIRIQACNVMVRQCVFNGNEMGILAGNISNCTITVEHCEFLNGGSTADPGYQHNIYINHVDSFIFRFNFSHDAIAEGHELKSRANFNYIAYNRISCINTTDSRNIDLPNGGVSVVMGNIIEQGTQSANSNLLGYGMEGLSNPGPHNLYVCNNTFVNFLDRGSFISLPASGGADTLWLYNNILAGAKTGGLITGLHGYIDSAANLVNDDPASFGFTSVAGRNYRPLAGSPAVDRGAVVSRRVKGHLLVPSFEYRDTAGKNTRPAAGKVDIGALEFTPPAAIQAIHSGNIYTLFPNPASGMLTLSSETRQPVIAYSVCSMEGKFLLGGIPEENKTEIDISDLPAGLYMLLIHDGAGMQHMAFLKN